MGCRSIQPQGKALPSSSGPDLSSGEWIAICYMLREIVSHVQGAEPKAQRQPQPQRVGNQKHTRKPTGAESDSSTAGVMNSDPLANCCKARTGGV